MRQSAFTLIEILLVIAIIATLTAILFPVFASIRENGRRLSCVSNLHQLGLAIDLYAQDSDDIVPLGGDPVDVNSNAWQFSNGGVYWQQAQQLRPLTEVMHPYVGNKDVWRCPSDNGFDMPDFSGGATFSAHPSAFDQYGSSYGYRTELAFRQVALSNMVAYDKSSLYAEHGASDIDLLDDLSGMWHGGHDAEERFNVLMGDGHVKTLTDGAMHDTRHLTLDKPVP